MSVAALVALFVYVHRLVDGLDTGGDAVSKWHFVRQWSWNNDFQHSKWTHHMTRMGVNVVAWIVQKLFGAEWQSYYIAPLFIGAAQVPLVYALSRRVSGRLGGVLAALVVTYLPAVHTAVSQLLPDLFVGTYALLATYLLARYAEATERKRGLLTAAAVVGFTAYLAKETAFFFYPGLFAAAWLCRRRFRDAVTFGGILLAGLALETLAYRLFTDYPHRLAIVRSVHFAGSDAEEPAELSAHGFTAIFRNLDTPWQYLLLAAVGGAVALLVLNRRARVVGQACALVGISQVALLSLASQLWQNPLPRYMIPAAPFAALGAVFLLTATLGEALRSLERRSPRALKALRSRRWLSAPPVTAALIVSVALAAGVWTSHQENRRPSFDGKARGARVAALANDTYDRNLPLFHNTRRAKPLVAVYDVYLSPERLVRAGMLPDAEEVMLRHQRSSYIVKDPAVYDRKVFGRLRKEGCVLEVRRGRARKTPSFADTSRASPLPAKCDALLTKLTVSRS